MARKVQLPPSQIVDGEVVYDMTGFTRVWRSLALNLANSTGDVQSAECGRLDQASFLRITPAEGFTADQTRSEMNSAFDAGVHELRYQARRLIAQPKTKSQRTKARSTMPAYSMPHPRAAASHAGR